MATYIIEGTNTAKLELLVNLAKELGLSVKQTPVKVETKIEARLKKGFKESKEIQAGNQKGVDAYQFLNGL
ncbi:hypothetical protein BDE36_2555 [Arcticibacter tournemirensis]|uniref:Uncharacterized protein n=1 Tax=Arcticibacter tournemirensis TaxID=699437 RepID=A0A5M9GPU6_9SPHI|nr:hypothetical protein [Arcticibacter tournemirensis]KAA8476773.1 hypothetical protein F1649_19570 [Arcticibacter tournemirensis]TQM50793.1 hypothetical protein BDE36_2555 [Arcticibacter tournemirensis]